MRLLIDLRLHHQHVGRRDVRINPHVLKQPQGDFPGGGQELLQIVQGIGQEGRSLLKFAGLPLVAGRGPFHVLAQKLVYVRAQFQAGVGENRRVDAGVKHMENRLLDVQIHGVCPVLVV